MHAPHHSNPRAHGKNIRRMHLYFCDVGLLNIWILFQFAHIAYMILPPAANATKSIYIHVYKTHQTGPTNWRSAFWPNSYINKNGLAAGWSNIKKKCIHSPPGLSLMSSCYLLILDAIPYVLVCIWYTHHIPHVCICMCGNVKNAFFPVVRLELTSVSLSLPLCTYMLASFFLFLFQKGGTKIWRNASALCIPFYGCVFIHIVNSRVQPRIYTIHQCF